MLRKLFGLGKKKDDIEVIHNANDKVAGQILEALGGKENILGLDACVTRLRVQLKDIVQANQEQIKELGATEIFSNGSNIQAVFGVQSVKLKQEIEKLIEGKEGTGKKGFVIPLEGKLLELNQVPDEVFASKMMGDGFAIEPSHGEVVSPVTGTITTIFPTKHAIGITAGDGLDILVHIGIDTVNLKGKGFELLVNEGDSVQAGQPILQVDLEEIKTNAKSIISPIIFTNLSQDQHVTFKAGTQAKRGEENVVMIQ
ncbi:glucose PTS transporter subunit IIA [Alkaliphilus crotonatoxidans]